MLGIKRREFITLLAGDAALTLNVFDEVGGVYVAAIVIAAILTLFLKGNRVGRS
jgi:hypothetical protein